MISVIFGTRKFSADELLKSKPERLPDFEPVENEPNNFTMDINKVTVHDVRYHKLVYGSNYVIAKFYDGYSKVLASLSVFGSCQGDKPDECFIVGFGSIISETSFRVMKSELEGK